MFNAEKSIINSLISIKNQTSEENFEVLIINDGSTDNSKFLVEKFITENPEMDIKLINQQNAGVSKARNTGLKIAKGELIAFLDSDDEWLPEKIEKQLNYLRNSRLDIDFLTTLRNHERIGFPYKIQENNLVEITLKKLLLKIVGQTSTAVFKRKILENTGYFDENQKYSEDANYWMRISENNKMFLLAQNLVYTGNGKKSFGKSGLSANLKEMEKGIQKNILEMYKTKRIGFAEYLFYFVISKLKYLVRPVRAKL